MAVPCIMTGEELIASAIVICLCSVMSRANPSCGECKLTYLHLSACSSARLSTVRLLRKHQLAYALVEQLPKTMTS